MAPFPRMPTSALAIAAQGIVSLNSLALAVAVARSVSIVEFAYFSLAIPIYAIALRAIRVLFLIPRQIRYRHEDIRDSGRAVSKAATLLSVAFSVPIAALCLALPPQYGIWILAISLCLPALIFYDATRNEQLSQRKFGRLLISDSVWLIISVCLFLLSQVQDHYAVPPAALIIMWATAPLVLGFINYYLTPRPAKNRHEIRREFRAAKTRTKDCVSDVLSSTLSVQALPYILAGLATPTLVAGFRGGQTLLGPVNTAVMGVTPLLQMSTAKTSSARKPFFITIKWSVIATLPAAAFGFVLYLLPDSIGSEILGETWSITKELLLATTATVAFRIPYLAAVTTLRSIGEDNLLVGMRAFSTITLLMSATLGAIVYDSSGAIWAIALSAAISSVLGIFTLHHSTKKMHMASADTTARDNTI